MELINNTTKTLKDDLSVEIKQGSKVSIAAACFSIYAFQELKAQLSQIDELRFIFTSPTFVTEKAKKEKREFYIPRLTRERSLWDYVDSLELQDRHYLSEFLKTDNQPIEVMGEAFGFGLLANRKIVACTDKKQKCAPALNRKVEFEGHLVFPPPDVPYMSYPAPTKLYRLKDDFFELLKHSYEKYGKISHFDMEEQENG